MAYVSQERRSFLPALYLHVLIRVKHLFLTWFYLKPLLCKHISRTYERKAVGPIPDFNITYATYLPIKLLWIIAAFFGQNPFLARFYYVTKLYSLVHRAFKPLERSVLRQCRRNGMQRHILPVPEFDWKHGDPKQLVEDYIEHPFPVVLRSFLSDPEKLRSWSFQSVLERFGDENVLLTTKLKDGFRGKLSWVQSGSVYCHSNESLFRKHPNLKDNLELKRLEALSGGRQESFSQLFIGKKGTGAPFHCAAAWNWYMMLDGRKHWYFVHPIYTPLIYPVLTMGRVALMSHCSFPDRYNKEAYPLFEYCPIHSVVLEKGDVLLTPSWWWHAVENLTEESVAVASRWFHGKAIGHKLKWTEETYEINRFFSVLLQLGLASPLVMQRFLRHPSPELDAQTTIRERLTRFMDSHYKISEAKYLGLHHKL